MHSILRAACGAAIAASWAIGAHAADFNLTISSWTSPQHGINSMQWPNFIKMMEEATDGRVTGEIKIDLAPPPAQMDLVLDGAVDMAIVFHGYQAGRFTGTKLIELPGYEGDAEAASVAYWRVHQKHLAQLDEHRGVKLVALHTHGPGQLHTADPVTDLDEVEDLKIRVPGGVGGDVGEALGAVGIKVPAPKVYETLASDAADGVVMPMEGRKGFRLIEVAPHVYELPGGFYRGSFAYIMNQETFDSFPEDIRMALEDEVFGEPTSRMLGQVWDKIDAIGRELTKETPGNEIHQASAEDVAEYEEVAEGVIENVLSELESEGVDADAAHEMVQDEMNAAAGEGS